MSLPLGTWNLRVPLLGSCQRKEQRKETLFSLLHSPEHVDLGVTISNKVILGQESLDSSDPDTSRTFIQIGGGQDFLPA